MGASLLGVVTVDPPVDVAEYVVSATTVLGVVIAAVYLSKFGFLVVKSAYNWARGFSR
jgi:hypothetical protein